MRQDAFTGGVEPGGLWSQNDIRILLCYILASVGAPLTREDLSRIVEGKGLANYFEVGDALSALVRLGSVAVNGDGAYEIAPAGREIAQSLDTGLPLSVRDKALEAAMRLLADARSRRENRVDIAEEERGYRVTCHVSGGDLDLMAVSVYVPDRAQAQRVEENFHRDPEGVYKLLLSALTGDRDYARSYFDGQNLG